MQCASLATNALVRPKAAQRLADAAPAAWRRRRSRLSARAPRGGIGFSFLFAGVLFMSSACSSPAPNAPSSSDDPAAPTDALSRFARAHGRELPADLLPLYPATQAVVVSQESRPRGWEQVFATPDAALWFRPSRRPQSDSKVSSAYDVADVVVARPVGRPAPDEQRAIAQLRLGGIDHAALPSGVRAAVRSADLPKPLERYAIVSQLGSFDSIALRDGDDGDICLLSMADVLLPVTRCFRRQQERTLTITTPGRSIAYARDTLDAFIAETR